MSEKLMAVVLMKNTWVFLFWCIMAAGLLMIP